MGCRYFKTIDFLFTVKIKSLTLTFCALFRIYIININIYELLAFVRCSFFYCKVLTDGLSTASVIKDILMYQFSNIYAGVTSATADVYSAQPDVTAYLVRSDFLVFRSTSIWRSESCRVLL